jgi:hypothetical protein
MSLWTPGGEHPVDRDAPSTDEATSAAASDDPLAGLTEDERERAMAMAAEMDEVRQQLASVPAAVVVANHAMGLYELAAIHLSAKPPNLPGASLAIDAVGILVDGLGDRLGPDAPTLLDALSNIRMAFVSIKSTAAAASSEASDGSGDDAAVADDDALGAQ